MQFRPGSVRPVLLTILLLLAPIRVLARFQVVDTGETACYDDSTVITCPPPDSLFYGQDSQTTGLAPSFTDNGDGTITDNRTGLTWAQSTVDSVSWDDAMAGAATFSLAGYSDWRVPTVKELYSLIDFSGHFGDTITTSIPFIDTDYFDFSYVPGERFFDVQEWTSTEYVGTTMAGEPTVFGVNFADGRIKGYPKIDPETSGPNIKFVRYVRGSFSDNNFLDLGDGTVRDLATGLMWSRDDSGSGMTWRDALGWVQARNAENYLGHDDWRLPNIKELQSIVDYTHAPDAVNPAQVGPAISSVFGISVLGDGNYPYFWSSTTEADGPPGQEYKRAAYIAFGLAKGWVFDPGDTTWSLLNVHGAGAQRVDPKTGDPLAYPWG